MHTKRFSFISHFCVSSFYLLRAIGICIIRISIYNSKYMYSRIKYDEHISANECVFTMIVIYNKVIYV